MTQTRKSGIADWFKSGWVALLIAIVTMIFVFGVRAQSQADTQRRVEQIEQNYVPKSEYQNLTEQLKQLHQDTQRISNKLDKLAEDQARLHGVKARSLE